jgi:membrane protein DedA with SNARE-associated domain
MVDPTIEPLVAFVDRHGLLVLFAFVLVEQLGLPLPAAPALVTVGVLAAKGHVSLATALAVSVAACLVADSAWFAVGRWRGTRVLKLLCRISLEPDSCVRRTQDVFARRGASTLLFAKFLPGLATVATPVAGLIRMRLWRFLAWDVAGAVTWSGLYLGLGWVFGTRMLHLLASAGAVGGRLAALVTLGVIGYLAWKHAQRRRFRRQVHLDRITPQELQRRLLAGEPIAIVDLRSAADFGAARETLPGAVRGTPDTMDEDLRALSPDREVVLFCT